MTADELDDHIKELYNLILQAANKFLHEGMNTPIEFLAEENPTYETIAELIEDVRKVIHANLFDFDPSLASQAIDYCDLMLKIGKAIAAKDADALQTHCDTLHKKPFFAI